MNHKPRFIEQISSKLINPIYQQLTQPAKRGYLKEAQAVLRSSTKCIQQHQLKRLRQVCSIAQTSEYYDDIFSAAGIHKPQQITFEEFATLPPLEKSTLRDHPSSLLPKGVSLKQLRQSATGGTTDSPVKLYMDWPSLHKRWAATEYFDSWLGYKPGLRMAYLWGAAQDFSANPSAKARLKNALIDQKLFLPSSPLNEEVFAQYYLTLKQYKPAALQAYPTPLSLFAQYLINNNLSLNIPAISCTAEPLLDHQREIITQAFGVTPHNWYGSREAGRVATECNQHQGMHLNSYNIYAETSANGDMGNLLITDLWNEGFPLLRYNTNDLASINHSPCPCGSSLPRLSEVTGRVADIFVGTTGSLVPGVALTNRIIKDCDDFQSMQLLQIAPGEISAKVVPHKECQIDTAQENLQQLIDDALQCKNILSIEVVSEIPKERSGKVRFCKNLMAPDELKKYLTPTPSKTADAP